MPAECSRTHWRTTAGFTLIELLVVLAVLALLAGTVAPLLGTAAPRTALSATAIGLRGALAAARSDAIASGRTVLFRAAPDGGYWVDRHYHRLATGAAPGLRLRVVAAGAGQLAFFPWGGSSGGSVRIEDRHGKRDIVVDAASGRAVLQP